MGLEERRGEEGKLRDGGALTALENAEVGGSGAWRVGARRRGLKQTKDNNERAKPTSWRFVAVKASANIQFERARVFYINARNMCTEYARIGSQINKKQQGY
jgi:hypothetical protein